MKRKCFFQWFINLNKCENLWGQIKILLCFLRSMKGSRWCYPWSFKLESNWHSHGYKIKREIRAFVSQYMNYHACRISYLIISLIISYSWQSKINNISSDWIVAQVGILSGNNSRELSCGCYNIKHHMWR